MVRAGSDPGVVMVRPFSLDDLERSADFCDRARAEDPSIEPFAQRLALIATGPRAMLPLWQVAEGEDGLIHGIAFAAVREQRSSASALSSGGGESGKSALGAAGRDSAKAAPKPAPPSPAGAADAPPLTLSRPPRQPYAGAPDLSSLAGGSRSARPPPILPVARPSSRTINGPARPPLPPVPNLPSVPKPRAPDAPPPELYAGPPAAPLAPRKPQRTTLELYAAVGPPLRRQGLGRALLEPSLQWLQSAAEPVALRARVKDDLAMQAGRAFLQSLGFAQSQAQLTLSWNQAPLSERELPALSLRQLLPGDAAGLSQLARLTDAAWVGAPDAFETRADEIAQLMSELGRLVILASAEGRGVGYLSGLWLGKTLAIEEVAVLPDYRRAGVGRALVQFALQRGARSALLSVSEENRAARAMYRSLGFTQTARRLIWTMNGGPSPE